MQREFVCLCYCTAVEGLTLSHRLIRLGVVVVALPGRIIVGPGADETSAPDGEPVANSTLKTAPLTRHPLPVVMANDILDDLAPRSRN